MGVEPTRAPTAQDVTETRSKGIGDTVRPRAFIADPVAKAGLFLQDHHPETSASTPPRHDPAIPPRR